MELHVAFLPQEIEAPERRAVVVIDVLRATTSLVTMLERGCDEVLIAPGLDAARRYREAHPDVLLAGERGGRQPEGFDFGNSPVALSQAALAGRRVVLATTNGTRAVHAVRRSPVVFVGCLRNRRAAARAVAQEAVGRGWDVTLVCAGREARFSLEDAYTAGAIAEVLLGGGGGPARFRPTDAALAARTLYTTCPDAESLFRTTRAGQNVIEIGLGEDLGYCAARDRSDLVPRVGDRVTLLDDA